MDCSPPGFTIHGIFQARVLEWGAIAVHQEACSISIYLSMKNNLEAVYIPKHSPKHKLFGGQHFVLVGEEQGKLFPNFFFPFSSKSVVIPYTDYLTIWTTVQIIWVAYWGIPLQSHPQRNKHHKQLQATLPSTPPFQNGCCPPAFPREKLTGLWWITLSGHGVLGIWLYKEAAPGVSMHMSAWNLVCWRHRRNSSKCLLSRSLQSHAEPDYFK